MRIVHTESSLEWRGQEIRVLAEAQGLIRRGHEVIVLCPARSRIFAEAAAWKVPAVALPIAKKRPAGIRALMDWFGVNRPDVVSTHSATDAWLTALALLVMGRPFAMVRTRHDSAPVPRNPVTRWLYTRATGRIVTAGELLRRELIERNGFAALRIDSVPTGMDPLHFRPGDRADARRRLGLPQEQPLVGIVAGLRPPKGHRYLVEAFAGLPQAVALVIVGDGPERAPLEAQVERLGLGERVRFAGHQRDVLPWLQAFDVFALPCCEGEGVPQALLQAMLAGLACVTTPNGGIPEIAKDGETALVVPPRQVGALREALSRVLSDRSLAGRLGAAARAFCEPRYSLERMLDEMERIYREASGRR